MLKKLSITTIIATLCLSFSALVFAATPINRIVAVVNNSVITQADLNEQVAFIKVNLQKNHSKLPPDGAIQQQVLSQMITRKLQLQLANRTGIQVSEMDVNNAVKKIAAQNHKTAKEMYESVKQLGLTRQAFRKEIKDELIMNKLQERDVAAKITITPQEVDDYLRSNAGQGLDTTQYHLATILVPLADSPSPAQIAAAKTQAEVIIKELHKGANFKTIAMTESKGQNALKGGDLGYKQLLQLPTVFANQVENMSAGQIKGPIQTENGFYIIKLIGTRSGGKSGKLSQAELKAKVENLIFQRKLHERIQNWIEQLRNSAYIKIYPQS